MLSVDLLLFFPFSSFFWFYSYKFSLSTDLIFSDNRLHCSTWKCISQQRSFHWLQWRCHVSLTPQRFTRLFSSITDFSWTANTEEGQLLSTCKPNDILYVFLIFQCKNSHSFQNILSLSTLALKTLYHHESWCGQLKFGNVARLSGLDYLTPKVSYRVMKHLGELITPR